MYFKFMVAQFCSILHWTQIQSPWGLDPVRASREFETISTLECKNRTQAHSKENFQIGLAKKEWAKQWQIESEKGTERAPSSRLVAAMDKFSKARPNMNKPSKWAEEASKWPNTGDLTPQFVPFFSADYIFLFWPLVLSYRYNTSLRVNLVHLKPHNNPAWNIFVTFMRFKCSE